jgi:hypothetical protein
MGCLSEIIAIVTLVLLWNNPEDKSVWWTILVLFIVNSLFTRVLKESLNLYGEADSSSKFWGVIVTLIQ